MPPDDAKPPESSFVDLDRDAFRGVFHGVRGQQMLFRAAKHLFTLTVDTRAMKCMWCNQPVSIDRAFAGRGVDGAPTWRLGHVDELLRRHVKDGWCRYDGAMD